MLEVACLVVAVIGFAVWVGAEILLRWYQEDK